MIEPKSTRPISVTIGCLAIERDMRQLYADYYHKSLGRFVTFFEGLKFTAPDGPVNIDPAAMADTVSCAAVKTSLGDAFAKYLPGAELVESVEEPPVIDSTWLYDGQEIVVEWDYTKDFADPTGLTVTVRTEVTQ